MVGEAALKNRTWRGLAVVAVSGEAALDASAGLPVAMSLTGLLGRLPGCGDAACSGRKRIGEAGEAVSGLALCLTGLLWLLWLLPGDARLNGCTRRGEPDSEAAGLPCRAVTAGDALAGIVLRSGSTSLW